MIQITIATSCSYFAFEMVPNHLVPHRIMWHSICAECVTLKQAISRIVVQYLILHCSPTIVRSGKYLDHTLMLYCIGCKYFILQ